MLDALAYHVELSLEGLGVGNTGAPGNEDLLDQGLDGACAWPDRGIVDRHRAPAQNRLPLFSGHRLEHGPAPRRLGRVAGQEYEAGAVVPGCGQGDAELAALPGEEGVRHLDQDAGAVSGIDLTPAGSAVEEVLEHLEGLADNGVGLPALHVDDEADAARVVLVSGIVEALGPGHPGWRRR